MNDWEQEQQESIPGSFRRAIMDLIIFKNDRDSTNDVDHVQNGRSLPPCAKQFASVESIQP